MIKEYLKFNDCINGYLYEVDGRNFKLAIFYNNKFYGIRYKFGHHFIDTEMHYDMDPKYGTVKPIKELNSIPYKILKSIKDNDFDTVEEYLNEKK